jgi:predicted kinase
MKFIKEYNQFIFEEVSKNEPIPEIIGIDRGLAIFLIGAPGIGKSYFVKNHIHTKNSNIKDFSTDDVSLLYTKDPNVYYRGKELPGGGRTPNASEMNLRKMEKFMETGQNFIYDTTGAGKEFTDKGFEHIKEIFDKAKENKYKIIFIHLLSTLETSIKQDELRDRHVDPHYIQWAYAKQQGGEIDGQKVEGNIQRYKALNPDAYYLVTSIDKKYKFYKFIDGKLAIRKNDRYVIKESVDNKDVTSQIVDTMLDLIEDGYKVFFKSLSGYMTYQQYLDGEGDFLPIFKPNDSLIRSKFSIEIVSNDKFKTYEDFVKIVDEMQVAIARLSDSDWTLVNFKVNTYNNDNDKDIFRSIEYVFFKPDQKLEVERKLNFEEFKTDFENRTSMNIEDIKVYDDCIDVDFSSSYYGGELHPELDHKFKEICDRWGFEEYDYNNKTNVSFYWDKE